jgi:hypothetical protein
MSKSLTPFRSFTYCKAAPWHRARSRRRPAYRPEPCGFRRNSSLSASAARGESKQVGYFNPRQ